MKNAKFPLMPVRIIFTWTMVGLAIVIYSICWFALSPVVTTVLTALESALTLTAEQQVVFDLITMALYWNPVLALFGWLIWGYLNSFRRTDADSWRV